MAPAAEFACDPQNEQLSEAEVAVYVPGTHAVQSADPAAALYLPGVQALHWAPDPVYPALQTHSVLPAVDCAWAGHAGVCMCV